MFRHLVFYIRDLLLLTDDNDHTGALWPYKDGKVSSAEGTPYMLCLWLEDFDENQPKKS